MKSYLRVLSVTFLFQFLCGEISAQCNPAPIINFVNPSFEGPQDAHVTPSPWSVCMPGTTPDTQPGNWGITMPPTNGTSYLGLVHQTSSNWQEGASEQLSTPFVAGTAYTFTIDLANILTSDAGIGIIPGCAELQIFGGYGPCDVTSLLWASGNIVPWDTWVTHTVSFTPSQSFTWVLIRINSLGCSDGPYILVDNIGPVTPSPPVAVPTGIAATCNGFNTGSAYIGYTGGQAPYSFQWSNGVTTQNNSNLFAGTYGVTITDANLCTATASIIITEPPAINASVSAVDATCGLSNGSLTANIISGNGPFTYAWDNGMSGPTISGLISGTYFVTITGANGCTNGNTPISGTVGSTGGLTLSSSSTAATCGINNGTATIDVTIGAGPFIYLWSNQGNTQTITGLGAGTYDVTVTGAGGCSATGSATVSATEGITLSTSTTNETCSHINGTATVDAVTGIGPFTYIWSNLETTQTILNLSAGTYDVTVNGVGGCSATASAIVAAANSLSLSITGTDAPCQANSGSATVDVTAGSGPFTYLWSNLETTQTITGLTEGTYDVTVTGLSGCSASAGVFIAVGDSTPPTAVCRSITVAIGIGIIVVDASQIDGGSSDNCVTYTTSVAPTTFDCTKLGPHTITLTVTDNAGNFSICNALVTVTDTTAPEAFCQDVTISLSGNTASVTVGAIDNGSRDNCGIVSRDISQETFDCSNVGVNVVTLTVADGANNVSSCNANVTVEDNTPPVATCQDISISLATTTASITPADVDNGSTDNCAIVSRTVVPDLFDCSNLGANSATFTVTDASGNSSSCTSSVTVNDLIPPTAVCQDVAKTLSGSSASVTPGEIDNASTDNCAIVSRTVTPDVFDCSNIGANTVTFTATDASGNASSCTATVTISDVTPPVAITRDITVSLIGSSVSITAADIDLSTDNCTFASTVVPNVFDCSDLGPNPVMLTVIDQSGNTSSAPATVTVIDDTPPTALCRNHSVTLVNGVASITTADVDNASIDNCTIVSRTVVPSEFTCATLGLNTAVLTVTDQSGNVSSCNAEVNVIGAAPFSCSITSILAPSNQITGGNSTTIYIGYGPQSTTLSSTITGQGQFTYSWTPTTGLSCTNCLSPVFTPTAQGNYTFTLTVSSSSGCSSTCEITICVLDVRADAGCNGGGGNGGGNSPGKIYVCHFPPGNIANMQLICIGVAGVPAHVPFHGGDRLGRCDLVCGSNKLEDEEVPELIADHNGAGFEMLIYPNPFSSQFHLKIESESTERIDMRIFNVMGQLVISQKGIEPNEDIQTGSQLANGFYFLEVQQAGFKKVIRLLKAR